jgi:uncharacterized membrane protein YoaK (UPF0700 family)
MPRSMRRAFPPVLSFVAGYVDGCTYLALFGLFVAQVTGSFVLAGAQLVTHDPDVVIKVVGIPVYFLAGFVTTVMIKSAERRGRYALPAALTLEAALLMCLMLSGLVGNPATGPNTPAVLLASMSGLSAMGVQSALVRLLVQGSPSTNVMTSNTTQLAIDASSLVLACWPLRNALPDTNAAADHLEVKRRLNELWPIMFCFFLGTLAGAVAYIQLGLWCMVLAIAIIGALTVWATASHKIGTNLGQTHEL